MAAQSMFDAAAVVLLLCAITMLFQAGEAATPATGVMGRPGCQTQCGNVTIPFPFGMESGCYLEQAFQITCNTSNFSTTSPQARPILHGVNLTVMEISLEQSTVQVQYRIDRSSLQSLAQSSYSFMDGGYAPVLLRWTIAYTTYESLLQSSLGPNNSTLRTSYCQIFNQSFVLCHCENGFQGNPYLPGGCQDIDECMVQGNLCSQQKMKCQNLNGGFRCYTSRAKLIIIGLSIGLGSLLLFIGSWGLYKVFKRRRAKMLKEKFFKRNGGLLLQEQLSSGEVNVDRIKMFSSRELEKATDRYNTNRMLGQGGQGTVYKGMLTDGRIIAVKTSKILDEENLRQFINEVVILSQISHRNVVKLLGCCLETEVPMLVYEFVPNGTLFEFIHDQNEENIPLTWEMRLRIAAEVAGALSYLHSAASTPIYHRDIKSTNILLDDKYRAKIADFGISRSITIDQTHVTTMVQGTFGYLDPEYFQSSQFTDKSDVYSFGVVLVELLTGQKPISATRSEESRGLVAYFLVAMEESRLFEILAVQVVKQGKEEDILTVANLAKRCLNLTGRQRPAMKQVSMELEGIQKLPNNFSLAQNHALQHEYDRNDMMQEEWEVFTGSTESCLDSQNDTGSSTDMNPFLRGH